MNKMTKKFQVTLFTLLGSYSLCAFGYASKDLTFHAFAAQGVIKSANNNFVNDQGESSFELTEFGLNASYQWQQNLRIAGQVVYLEGGNRYKEGARLDYLFVDWSVANELDWKLNFYFGRYKNHNGLYSSTRDVPHTRPSIILPQSMYYDILRDITVGNDGIALSYNTDSKAGGFDVFWSYGVSPISDKESQLLFGEYAKGNLDMDFIHQFSLFFRPNNSAWQYGISMLDTRYDYTASQMEPFFDVNGTAQRVMFNLLYSGEKWEFAAELMQERQVADGFITPRFHSDTKGQGAYVQGRYFLDNQLTVLLRYDRFDNDKEDRKGRKLEQTTGGSIPAYFGYMYDATAGITYQLSNMWQIQAEYHWLEGAGRLSPAARPNSLLNNKKHHSIWAIQLSYWF